MNCPLCGASADLGLTKVYCSRSGCTNYAAPVVSAGVDSAHAHADARMDALIRGVAEHAARPVGFRWAHPTDWARYLHFVRNSMLTFRARTAYAAELWSQKLISHAEWCELVDEIRANPSNSPPAP